LKVPQVQTARKVLRVLLVLIPLSLALKVLLVRMALLERKVFKAKSDLPVLLERKVSKAKSDLKVLLVQIQLLLVLKAPLALMERRVLPV
jgi:hypothetical protein